MQHPCSDARNAAAGHVQAPDESNSAHLPPHPLLLAQDDGTIPRDDATALEKAAAALEDLAGLPLGGSRQEQLPAAPAAVANGPTRVAGQPPAAANGLRQENGVQPTKEQKRKAEEAAEEAAAPPAAAADEQPEKKKKKDKKRKAEAREEAPAAAAAEVEGGKKKKKKKDKSG